MVDFNFYLNRQGPRGPKGLKGDKGDDGKTPVPRTGTNTPIETTVIFDIGDGNPYETPNLKYQIEDRGGNMVMLDRTNSTQYYGTPDQATDNSYGVVKLATPESILDDPLDNDVVTYELLQSYSPPVGNGTITIKQGDEIKGVFTTNQSENQTIELESGGGGGGTTYTAGDGIDLTDDIITVKVDGDTITTNANGELSAINSVPSNIVTTDTTQEITGTKTFSNVSGTYFRERSDRTHNLRIHYPGGSYSHIIEIVGTTDDGHDSKIVFENNMEDDGGRLKLQNANADVVIADGSNNIYPLLTKKKTINQYSGNISVSSGVVTVLDDDVTRSTIVTLYPGNTATETWLADNMTSNIITEGTGNFTFNISDTLPSLFSMYYTIQGVK